MDDFELRRNLGRLRDQEREPPHGLWPAIEARLGAQSAPSRSSRPSYWPWAMLAPAAMLVLLVSFGSRWAPGAGEAVPPAVASQDSRPGSADLISLEYRAALAELAAAPLPPDMQALAHSLDQDARRIRQALSEAPESRLLIDQLRRTYAWRLRISKQYLAAESLGRNQARSV